MKEDSNSTYIKDVLLLNIWSNEGKIRAAELGVLESDENLTTVFKRGILDYPTLIAYAKSLGGLNLSNFQIVDNDGENHLYIDSTVSIGLLDKLEISSEFESVNFGFTVFDLLRLLAQLSAKAVINTKMRKAVDLNLDTTFFNVGESTDIEPTMEIEKEFLLPLTRLKVSMSTPNLVFNIVDGDDLDFGLFYSYAEGQSKFYYDTFVMTRGAYLSLLENPNIKRETLMVLTEDEASCTIKINLNGYAKYSNISKHQAIQKQLISMYGIKYYYLKVCNDAAMLASYVSGRRRCEDRRKELFSMKRDTHHVYNNKKFLFKTGYSKPMTIERLSTLNDTDMEKEVQQLLAIPADDYYMIAYREQIKYYLKLEDSEIKEIVLSLQDSLFDYAMCLFRERYDISTREILPPFVAISMLEGSIRVSK